MNYQKKAVRCIATQWFKRGDHPAVYSWAISTPILSKEGEFPMVLGEPTEWAHSVIQYDDKGIPQTSDPMHPGYWVVEFGNKHFRGYSPEKFAEFFEPYNGGEQRHDS